MGALTEMIYQPEEMKRRQPAPGNVAIQMSMRPPEAEALAVPSLSAPSQAEAEVPLNDIVAASGLSAKVAAATASAR